MGVTVKLAGNNLLQESSGQARGKLGKACSPQNIAHHVISMPQNHCQGFQHAVFLSSSQGQNSLQPCFHLQKAPQILSFANVTAIKCQHVK